MAGHDGGTGEEPGHVGGGHRLAGVRPQGVQVGGEDPVRAEQRFGAHRGRDVGEPQQGAQIVAREDQHAQHPVGAVDEGESFLLGEHDGIEARRGESLCGRYEPARGVADVALAGECEGHVGEGREIPGTAEAAVLGHHRGDARIQHRGVGRGRPGTDPGVPGGEGRQPQQHHRTDHFPFHLGAGPGGVGSDYAALQIDS